MPSREPKYGVELQFDELNSQTPMSILYGVTENNKFIPIQIDTEGRFRLGSGVTLDVENLELGDVGITGTDPVTTNDHKIAISDEGAGNGFSIRSSIWDGGNKLVVNADGSLNVTQAVAATDTPINQFDTQTSIPSGSEQLILSYVVPVGKILKVKKIIGWGTYDGEFILRIDGTQVGGGRTSAANRTLDLSYEAAPMEAVAGQQVNIYIEHYSSSTESFSANLLGGLL